MNWKNLKDNACPKCCGVLEKTAMGFKCSHDIGFKPCDFVISTRKFEEIVTSLYSKKKVHIPTEEENLSALNNL